MSVGLPFDRDVLVGCGFDRSVHWDVVVVGGGATGLGTAVDAASRGYRTLLVEQSDFGKGTSSRSTKLVHGGVRYLRQGNVSLVLEALRERGRLLQNAPHLVHAIPFVIPCFRWWERPYYGFGLKVYQALSGRRAIGSTTILNREATIEKLPNLAKDRLRGGVEYFDGQFDDARLLINLAKTCAALGGVPLNYVRVTGLQKESGRIEGVVVRELEAGKEVAIKARVVINATGVFADGVRRLDDPQCAEIIRPSQGIHIVLPRHFHPGGAALMLPKTDDGRVLFVIPWHNRTIVGTTDTPVQAANLEPVPLPEEVDYLLEHVSRYLKLEPKRSDVLSMFAGLRPLVASDKSSDTKAISRDHVIRVSPSGLVTVTGGKWTTYRQMAEDAVDYAARVGGLDREPSQTASLRIRGWQAEQDANHPPRHEPEGPSVREEFDRNEGSQKRLHKELPIQRGDVEYMARHEMARTVEDVLARRTRCLFLDAKASMEVVSEVSELLAAALQRDVRWQEAQTNAFLSTARRYLPPDAEAGPKGRTEFSRGARHPLDAASPGSSWT